MAISSALPVYANGAEVDEGQLRDSAYLFTGDEGPIEGLIGMRTNYRLEDAIRLPGTYVDGLNGLCARPSECSEVEGAKGVRILIPTENGEVKLRNTVPIFTGNPQ